MLVLIDSPITNDHRVSHSIQEQPTVFNISNKNQYLPINTKISIALTAIIATKCILRAPHAIKKLKATLSRRVMINPFSGMNSCLCWTFRAIQASKKISQYCEENSNSDIHAHDLYCGLAASLAKRTNQNHLIYNAHELEIHRNRKIGWLRLILEYGFEQRVLSAASEVIVVNQAIKDVMLSWYKITAPIRIENNDFYKYHPVSLPPPSQPTAIVYVGMATEGRLLERLDSSPHPFGCDVHLYLLGKPLPSHISGKFWHFGPADYERSLLELSRSKRCLMWCCLETRSLSYQLATPNKFFQALAMGIPILASEDSYLANIVKRYNIGLVLDGKSEPDLTAEAASPRFEQWVQNILNLREAILKKEVVI